MAGTARDAPPDRRMLVTGASSGVGKSLVHYFAPRYEIIAVARRADTMRDEFARYSNVSVHQVDLGDQCEVSRFCSWLSTEYETVSHVINNAGVNRRAPVTELPGATLQESIQVNAMAPLTIMQAVLPAMTRRDYGRIVNVTSGAPLNCFSGFAAYSGSKALLNAVTVTAAREHESWNVKINLMSPGPVRSEMSPQSEIEPSVCHPTADYLVGLGPDGPTGRFFWLGHEVPLFPDLEGVDWLAGDAAGKLRKVL